MLGAARRWGVIFPQDVDHDNALPCFCLRSFLQWGGGQFSASQMNYIEHQGGNTLNVLTSANISSVSSLSWSFSPTLSVKICLSLFLPLSLSLCLSPSVFHGVSDLLSAQAQPCNYHKLSVLYAVTPCPCNPLPPLRQEIFFAKL